MPIDSLSPAQDATPAAPVRRTLWAAACLVVPLAAGCVGAIDGAGSARGLDAPGAPAGREPGSAPPGAGAQAGTAGAGPGAGGQGPAAPPGVGPMGLRRLTRRELDNTLHDLLGDETHPARKFVADPSPVASGYVTFQPLGSAELQQYADAAETLAAAAVQRLSALAPCAPGADEPSCAQSFIRAFGKRAFRRPLAADEAQLLLDLYSGVRARTRSSHADGIRVVLAAMLQDPRFLYQRQLGAGAPTAGGLVALDAYDMASRLSYALWRTMPDQTLFDAADAGRLVTEADVRAQATRMLADPRAREATAAWAGSLIGLDRLESLTRPADEFPEWSPALAVAMRADTEAFVGSVVLDGDARVETLLTAPVAFVDATLARVYGVSGVAGAAPTRVDLDPARRAGLVTQASLLTASPSPVLRGKFVREQLFCQRLPPPPADAQGKGKAAPPGATARERASTHASDPACAACHALMDPIGFTLLSFDAIGRFQASDQGKPVDNSGKLAGTDVDGALAGPADLAARLSTSAGVKSCLTLRWFRALLDRADTDDDAASLAAARTALASGARPVRDMLLALATSPAFRFRKPLDGEKAP